MGIARKEIYEKQYQLCSVIGIYPDIASISDLEKRIGLSADLIKRAIVKMNSRYLLAEDYIEGETYYFFGYAEAKTRTLAFIQERIRALEETKNEELRLVHKSNGNRK